VTEQHYSCLCSPKLLLISRWVGDISLLLAAGRHSCAGQHRCVQHVRVCMWTMRCMLVLTSRSYRPKGSRLLSASMYTRKVHLVGTAAACWTLVKASNTIKTASRGLRVLQAQFCPPIVCIMERATVATSDRGCDSARQRHRMHEVCAALAGNQTSGCCELAQV
jgi:hypothetical protein